MIEAGYQKSGWRARIVTLIMKRVFGTNTGDWPSNERVSKRESHGELQNRAFLARLRSAPELEAFGTDAKKKQLETPAPLALPRLGRRTSGRRY